MKKKTKWIILAASISAAVLIAVGIILFFVFRHPYLNRIPYDDVKDTMYRNTAIVAEDGLWYLEVDGKQSERGYTYLKSINDFYPDTRTEDLASRQLFDFYLARSTDHGNYLLLDSAGNEYKIGGDNFSLTEVALPYLIFTNNTNSRMAALSLSALQSELSARSDTEIAFSQTFSQLSAHKLEDENELYDYLLAKTDSEEKGQSIFSSSGARLFSGTTITPLLLKKENGDPVFYFMDEGPYALYSVKGTALSPKGERPVIFEEKGWGYQLCESTATGSAEERFLLVFTTEHTFTLSDTKYDLDTLQVFENCLWLRPLHADTFTVVSPKTHGVTDYQSLRTEAGLLTVTLANEKNQIYLDGDGREILRSPYDDMQRHELSRDNYTVLTSVRCNAEGNKTLSYFFTSPQREAVRLDLPIHATISVAPTLSEEQKATTPTYLIQETDQDGTALCRLYTPFSVTSQSANYHTLDFYCHGGILWALGTSYTRECYEILDPVNNRVSLTISAKSGDLARLTFEFCDVDALLADPSKEESSVPVLLLKLSRYDEKQTQAVAARYFALFRTASAESKTFQNTTLQVKELGQNLLLSQPYRFFGTQNCLAIYSLSGTRIFRLDEAFTLNEYASIPYHVTDLLPEHDDPTNLYLKITPVMDGSDTLTAPDAFGITDSQGNLLLPPVYEEILEADDNRFIVSLRNALGVVEHKKDKVKTIIDFEYVTITYMGDGGYAAQRRNGTCDLYREGRKLKKGELHSISPILHAKTDDDGYLVLGTSFLLNLDGKLYLHATEHAHPPICESVKVPDSYSYELADRRAKLISYYNDSGTLESTDLLLPTVTDQKAFMENHKGDWYTSALPQKQTDPLTPEEILASEEHFFHLYPSAISEEDTEEAPLP